MLLDRLLQGCPFRLLQGCLALIGVLVALLLAFVLVWFLIEIAIPVIFFLLYLVVRGMLAQVINGYNKKDQTAVGSVSV